MFYSHIYQVSEAIQNVLGIIILSRCLFNSNFITNGFNNNLQYMSR